MMADMGRDRKDWYWSAQSEYEHWHAEPRYDYRYILSPVQQMLRNLPATSTVVDAGCGNGAFLSLFQDRGWKLYGVDISRSGIEAATAAFPFADFRCMDIATQAASHPAAGQADVVLAIEVIEHVFLPRTFIQGCFELLRPGGVLIISTPYHGYLKYLAISLFGGMDRHVNPLWDFGHIKFWSRHMLNFLLEEAGFRVQAFHGAGRVPFLWKSMVLKAAKPK